MEPTLIDALAQAFLWASMAAMLAVMVAVVVGLWAVSRKQDPPFTDDGQPTGIGAARTGDRAKDDEIVDTHMKLMMIELRAQAGRQKRTAKRVRAAMILVLALWILGPLVYAFFVYTL